MLRIHVVQVCYDLSDPAMEDLLYDTPVARRFAGLDPQGSIPDETTILNFRHLLERHELGAGAVRGDERLPVRAGGQVEGRDHSGRHHHQRAVVHEEQGEANATPRCTR